MSVTSQPLAGSMSSGQADDAQTRSDSARSSTKSPGRDHGSSESSTRSGSKDVL